MAICLLQEHENINNERVSSNSGTVQKKLVYKPYVCIGLPARAQKEKGKKMDKLLTRLTSHVYRKKERVTFYFSSYRASCTCTRTLKFFFSGMGNYALGFPGGGGVPLDKPYRLMRR